MIYVILGYFIACVGGFAYRKIHPLRFDFTVTLAWLAATVLNTLPVFVARTDFSATTAILIICSHGALVAGFHVGGGPYSVRSVRDRVGDDRRLGGGILFWASSAFVGLTAVSAALTGALPIVGTIPLVQTARLEFLGGTAPDPSLAASLAQMLKYPAIAFVCLLPVFIKHRHHGHAIVAILAALAVVEGGLRLGGRSDFVLMLLALGAAWIVVFPVNLARGTLLAIAAALAFVYLGSSFVLARNSNFKQAPDFFVRRTCPVEHLGSWLTRSASTNTRALALSTCYFVAPTHNLDDFVANADWSHMLGRYNLGLVDRSSFRHAREEIAWYYRWQGQGTNPWATSVRDFWLDFGMLAPLAFLPLGALIARVAPVGRRDDHLAVTRIALLTPVALMTPFISPLVIPSLVYPLVLVAALGAATRAATPSESSVVPVQDTGVGGVPTS